MVMVNVDLYSAMDHCCRYQNANWLLQNFVHKIFVAKYARRRNL